MKDTETVKIEELGLYRDRDGDLVNITQIVRPSRKMRLSLPVSATFTELAIGEYLRREGNMSWRLDGKYTGGDWASGLVEYCPIETHPELYI